MIELNVIRDLVAIFGVIAGFTYYVLTVRNAQKTQQMSLDTRKTSIFLQMYGTITPELIDRVSKMNNWEFTDYEDFYVKYGDKFAEWESVFQRYNGIGLLAKQDQVDLNLIFKLLGFPIFRLMNNYESIIEKQKELQGIPDLYEGLEYLFVEAKKRYSEIIPANP